MIIAVCGGKGGVGKSTVSLNLGLELDAVVVDADLMTPDLPWGRGPDLHDVLAERAAPLEAVEEIGPVKLLPCGRTLAGARAADLGTLRNVVDVIDRQYGRVIIDCPAGLAADVGYQLFSADAAILVTIPKRTGISNAFRTRQLAQSVESPVVGAVLNKAAREGDELIAERIEKRLGAPTFVVEKRPEIAQSQEKWFPVRELYPDLPEVETFEELAKAVEESERQIGGAPNVVY